MFKNYQKGVSLYLALMIMFILIAIGLGISLIIVSQMKMMKGMGDSVVAFYAADTGIEHSLYNYRIQGGDGNVSGSCGTDCEYNVTASGNTWKSKGSFAKAKRAIEITSPVAGLCNFTLDTQCGAPPQPCLPLQPPPCSGVVACWGTNAYDFCDVTVTAEVIPGYSCTTVTFSTNGIDLGGGCYRYDSTVDPALDGFEFEACFLPSSCDLLPGSCSVTLDLERGAAAPPPTVGVSTSITIYGKADGTEKSTQLKVDLWSMPTCLVPW